ncbi:unnamed protein product [Closterium sp. Naga37s-1]|nr:unnamed protein product [Closterium sp. Naga37s-1]
MLCCTYLYTASAEHSLSSPFSRLVVSLPPQVHSFSGRFSHFFSDQLKEFEGRLAATPDNREVLEGAAVLYAELGQYGQAAQDQLKEFEGRLAATPDNREALEGAAVLYAELGQYGQAAQRLEQLSKARALIAPEDPEVQRLLGEVRFELSEYGASAAAYRRAVKVSPVESLEVLQGLTARATKGTTPFPPRFLPLSNLCCFLQSTPLYHFLPRPFLPSLQPRSLHQVSPVESLGVLQGLTGGRRSNPLPPSLPPPLQPLLFPPTNPSLPLPPAPLSSLPPTSFPPPGIPVESLGVLQGLTGGRRSNPIPPSLPPPLQPLLFPPTNPSLPLPPAPLSSLPPTSFPPPGIPCVESLEVLQGLTGIPCGVSGGAAGAHRRPQKNQPLYTTSSRAPFFPPCPHQVSPVESLEVLQGLTGALLADNKPQQAVEIPASGGGVCIAVDELLAARQRVEAAAGKEAEEEGVADEVQVALLLGKAYAAWGRPGDAAAVYDGLIASRPDDFRGYLAKGLFLKDNGNQAEADRMFLQARYLAPNQVKVLVDRLAKR